MFLLSFRNIFCSMCCNLVSILCYNICNLIFNISAVNVSNFSIVHNFDMFLFFAVLCVHCFGNSKMTHSFDIFVTIQQIPI